jgi:hypothetical protein
MAGDARHRPSPPAARLRHGPVGPCLSRGGAGAMPSIASLHGQAPSSNFKIQICLQGEKPVKSQCL